MKLRCAACNKLASNAFRMPCCDQSICEICMNTLFEFLLVVKTLIVTGQSSLPQACPVCLHEPVKAEDCRPNKALRTTIKVFLRKKGIERETARKKELVEKVASIPATPAIPQLNAATSSQQPQEHIAHPTVAESSVDGTPSAQDGSHVPQSSNVSNTPPAPQVSSAQEQMDIPRPSIEVSCLSHTNTGAFLILYRLSANLKKQCCKTTVWE